MNTYGKTLDALADPTRRGIIELLRVGPRSVGAIAAGLPVSRPAVSQHLRVLEAAGLVRHRRDGTRNVYAIDPGGLSELRTWIEAFWDDALARFAEAAERQTEEEQMTDTGTMTIASVRKSVHVACSLELAFEVFTRDAGSWWPTETHAVHAGLVAQLVWEGSEGGAVYEVSTDGQRAHWGTLLSWEPPHRFVLSWEIVPGRAPTEIEVRFSADGAGTRVELEHRGWERLGEPGRDVRDNYETGWDTVLDPYVRRLG